VPEDWGVAIWHTEAELAGTAEAAVLLGLSVPAAAAVAGLARDAVRAAYLQLYAAGGMQAHCQATAERLGHWVRGQLSWAGQAAADQHLRICRSCWRAYCELIDLGGALRQGLAPLIMGDAAAYCAELTGRPDAARRPAAHPRAPRAQRAGLGGSLPAGPAARGTEPRPPAGPAARPDRSPAGRRRRPAVLAGALCAVAGVAGALALTTTVGGGGPPGHPVLPSVRATDQASLSPGQLQSARVTGIPSGSPAGRSPVASSTPGQLARPHPEHHQPIRYSFRHQRRPGQPEPGRTEPGQPDPGRSGSSYPSQPSYRLRARWPVGQLGGRTARHAAYPARTSRWPGSNWGVRGVPAPRTPQINSILVNLCRKGPG
jgi:hypothetical protein